MSSVMKKAGKEGNMLHAKNARECSKINGAFSFLFLELCMVVVKKDWPTDGQRESMIPSIK